MNKLPPYIEPAVLSHKEIASIAGFENISKEKAQELVHALAIFTEIVYRVETHRQKTKQSLPTETKVIPLNKKPLKSKAA